MSIRDELEDHEAFAFAQLLKRIGWSEIRANAVDDDEAYLMRTAIDKIRNALAEEGIAPR